MTFSISRLNLSEKDVEDYFFENPQMCRNGEYWQVAQWLGRQYKLPSGIADLVGVANDGRLVVAELKNVPADGRAIAQVCRYARDLRQILEYRWNYDWYSPHGPVVEKVVIAPLMESVNVYFEADACEVLLLEFKASLQVDVYTAYPETQQDLDRYHGNAIRTHDIAGRPEWDVFGPYSLPGDQFRALMAQRHAREMLHEGGDAEHF